jgi:hypothetical protein
MTDYYHPFRAGAIDLEVQPGIYRVEAKSSPAFVGSQDTARKLWAERAQTACASQNFSELAIRESQYEVQSDSADRASAAVFGPLREDTVLAIQSTLPRMKVGVRMGYAVCGTAGITPEEAAVAIQAKGWKL